MINKINRCFQTPHWLFALLLVVLLLRIPTLFEPYHYQDEMTYLTLGEGVRQGLPLYSELQDNKPPLIYLTAAFAGGLFWFKAILALWHIVTVYLFWKLTSVMFPKSSSLQMLATAVFAILTTIPLWEGNRANTELFALGPVLAGMIIILKKKYDFGKLMLAGVMFSVASLYRIPAVLDLVAALFFLLLVSGITKSGFVNFLKRAGYLFIGFLLPLAITAAILGISGVVRDYSVSVFLQNLSYVSAWGTRVSGGLLAQNAPLFLRGVMLASGVFILFIYRRRFSKNFIFLSAWLGMTLFAATITERPYPHYLLQTVPAAAILASLFFSQRTMESMFALIPLALFAFIPYFFNFWHYPTFSYYRNFFQLATNNISKEAYFEYYGPNVSRDYEIANYIKRRTKQEDKVFVCSNKASVYALSKRLPPIKYVNSHHIEDYFGQANLLNHLKHNPPGLVVTTPEVFNTAEMEVFLNRNYVMTQEVNGATIWQLLSPSVRSNQVQ
jgi:hypothetical protein